MSSSRSHVGYQAAATSEDFTKVESQGVSGESGSADVACRHSLRKFWKWSNLWKRQAFLGALVYNLIAFILPAILPLLRRIWLPQTNASHVSTNDAFKYVEFTSKLLAEGLPRGAWIIIADSSLRSYSQRLRFANTLILFQTAIGFVAVVLLSLLSSKFAIPGESSDTTRRTLTYISLVTSTIFPRTIEGAIGISSRSLDRPDIPLLISVLNFTLQVLLGVFHGGALPNDEWGSNAYISSLARIELVASLISVIFGLIYFYVATIRRGSHNINRMRIRPSASALLTLARPGLATFAEASIRNGMAIAADSSAGPLRLIHRSAWEVFLHLRWDVLMASTFALEATAAPHIAHNWSRLHAQAGATATRVRCSMARITLIAQPAVAAIALGLALQLPLDFYMLVRGSWQWPLYLTGGSEDVAGNAEMLWWRFSWCFLGYVVGSPLATLLLSTKPRWFALQSVAVQVFWLVPWTLAHKGKQSLDRGGLSRFAIIFAGQHVVGLLVAGAACLLWVWFLRRGTMRFGA